jgi:hypothetical protein
LLGRMHAKIHELCEQADRLTRELPAEGVGALGGRRSW